VEGRPSCDAECENEWAHEKKVPAWVGPDREAGFAKFLDHLAEEFEERWEFNPTVMKTPAAPGRMLIEQEILCRFRRLRSEWDIPNTLVLKVMGEVHGFIPIEWRGSTFADGKKEVSSTQLRWLIEYLEARFSDRWFERQAQLYGEKALREKVAVIPPKNLAPGNFKKLAFVLWVAVKIVNFPNPVSEQMVRRLGKDHDRTIPVIWRERLKQMGRALCLVGNNGELGIIEHFISKAGGKEVASKSGVADHDKLYIGMACMFLIKRTVGDFLRVKLTLGNNFAADVWLSDYMRRTKPVMTDEKGKTDCAASLCRTSTNPPDRPTG
jgi:hypothetical protein